MNVEGNLTIVHNESFGLAGSQFIVIWFEFDQLW